MIAALFVDPEGVYANRPGVDPWDEKRDARLFSGTERVIAHPPCERWGRFAEGSPTHKRFKLGDDGGCFAAAAAVRKNGGVIEHPQGSHAFRAFGLPIPEAEKGRSLGWTVPDAYGGRSCHVDQGAYGHKAQKPTWLYAVLPAYPELNWKRVWGLARVGGDGFHSTRERQRAKATGRYKPYPQIPQSENHLTPEPFAELLVSLASVPGEIRRGPKQAPLLILEAKHD